MTTWIYRVLVGVLALGLPLSAAQEKQPATVTQLKAAIKHNPFDPKLYVALGLAYWDANDSPQALEAFQQAVKLGPNSAEAHNWLGVALMEKSDLPGAIAELRKAVALDPKYTRAYANLGSALSTSGDLSEAVEVFKKDLALEPNGPAAQLNLGIALRQTGDAEGALVYLRRVVKAEPGNFRFQYELGQTLRQSGDLQGSIEAFEKAVEINPELNEGYYGLGLALKQQSASTHKPTLPPASPADDEYKQAQESAAKGDLNSAKQLLTNALLADEHHAEAHNLLGYILGQQGDMEFALNHLQRAIQLRPDYADAHYNYGVALWYSGSKEKAIPELRESVRLDPASGAAYAFLGMALRDKGDLQAARSALQRAIALLPPTTATYVDLGIVFLASGDLDHALGQFEAGLNAPGALPTPDWDTAITKLREALAKNPSRADAHNMLALLLGRKGAESNEVLAEFREAIRLRPDYAQAHNNIGLVLAQSDEDEKAVAEFREAIRLSPNYADAHTNLGTTLIPTNVEQAIVELEKAVALQPASAKAHFNLAEAYGRSPNHGPAKQIEELRKVTSLSPTFAPGHLALGKALLQDGKVPEAVAELQEAVHLNPQSGEAHYQLGLALARSGKQQEAAAEAQKGRELSANEERDQNATLDIAEGRAALDKGELEEAAAKFRHALRLQPDSAEAQRYLGQVLQQKGINPPAQEPRPSAAESFSPLPENPAPKLLTPSSFEDDSAKIAEFERYIREQKFQEVEPMLADYVKQRPKSSWGWYAYGYTLFANKKLGGSIQALAKSLQLDIKNAEAHKILGRDLMIIGRFDAAQTEFEQGIRYDPQSAEMHYNLGKLFSIQDNWQPARKEFEQALRIDPSYMEALDALGFAQESLGDNVGAVASYEKAIALDEEKHGKFSAPYVNLSAHYNRTGDPGKGLEYAQKALELSPESDRAWFQKAKAEDLQGHLENAVESLNHAIAYNPRASSYYYVLAGLYRRLGKIEDSKKALDSFARLDRENNDLEKVRRSSVAPANPSPGGKRE